MTGHFSTGKDGWFIVAMSDYPVIQVPLFFCPLQKAVRVTWRLYTVYKHQVQRS